VSFSLFYTFDQQRGPLQIPHFLVQQCFLCRVSCALPACFPYGWWFILREIYLPYNGQFSHSGNNSLGTFRTSRESGMFHNVRIRRSCAALWTHSGNNTRVSNTGITHGVSNTGITLGTTWGE